MRADDDGFVGNPKIICRTIGASEDDLKLLIAKRFILVFEDGVIVIKHWRMHNTLSRDRYKETNFLEDKALLRIKENKAYTLGDKGTPIDDTKLIESSKRQTDATKTQQRRNIDATKTQPDKIRIDKDSIEKKREDIPPAPAEKNKTYGEYSHVKLKDTDVEKLIAAYGEETTNKAITYLDEYIEMKGYKAKNHYLCIKKWVIDAVKEKESKTKATPNTKAQELSDFYNVASEWAESED